MRRLFILALGIWVAACSVIVPPTPTPARELTIGAPAGGRAPVTSLPTPSVGARTLTFGQQPATGSLLSTQFATGTPRTSDVSATSQPTLSANMN